MHMMTAQMHALVRGHELHVPCEWHVQVASPGDWIHFGCRCGEGCWRATLNDPELALRLSARSDRDLRVRRASLQDKWRNMKIARCKSQQGFGQKKMFMQSSSLQ